MKARFTAAGVKFFLSVSRYVKVTGVNSKLSDGLHLIMWDFDNVNRYEVIEILEKIQQRFKLPPVYIICSGYESNFHAYCFDAVSWAKLLYILASTPKLDQMYFKIGVIRGYFTLRITRKQAGDFTEAHILPSNIPELVNPLKIKSFIEYETKRR